MRIQVGLLASESAPIWRTTSDEAGRGLFTLAEGILVESGLRIGEIDAFIFCEGPGSMLGTRTVAMALRTWQALKSRPCFAYQSLAVAGHYEWLQNGRQDFAIIADARRDSWHRQHFQSDGEKTLLQRIPTAELMEESLVTPEHFRVWATPPYPSRECSYDLAKIFPTLGENEFFRAVEEPDAFQHEAPEYKKWAAQVHSVETANKK